MAGRFKPLRGVVPNGGEGLADHLVKQQRYGRAVLPVDNEFPAAMQLPDPAMRALLSSLEVLAVHSQLLVMATSPRDRL